MDKPTPTDKPTPRILKFKQGEKSFFVMFADEGLDDISLGSFVINKQTVVFTDIAQETHIFEKSNIAIPRNICKLWCVLYMLIYSAEFIYKLHFQSLNTEASNKDTLNNLIIIISNSSTNDVKIDMANIDKQNIGEYNFVTDELNENDVIATKQLTDYKMLSQDNHFNILDLADINGPNEEYDMLHSEKMFMKKDDGGGGSYATESAVVNGTQIKYQMLTRPPTAGGNPSSHIHTGQRGGRFVMVGGRKRYLRK